MADNKSKYRGVYWSNNNSKWYSKITTKQVTKHLGYFINEEQAFNAFCDAYEIKNGFRYVHHEPIFDYEKKIAHIPLSSHTPELRYAIIDIDDYEKVKNFHWSDNGDGYAHGRDSTVKVKVKTAMHRIIMGHPDLFVDHINGNRLDNRKANLRLCTQADNNKNNKGRGRYKGAHLRDNMWHSSIKANGKSIHIGTFKSEVNAAQAYNFAAEKYHGEFANYNYYNGRY